MSAQKELKRVTTAALKARKGGEKLVCLTAYDAPTAQILDPYCDVLLVGDSLGMVVHGMDTTIGGTVEMMILHGRAVMRGARRSLVVIDLPFGSYEESPEQAFRTAARVLSETAAHAVKIESGVYAGETIRYLTQRGVPVMAHVGLRPQAALVDGGFKAKGRDAAEADIVMDEARQADEAGAFSIVIEGTDAALAGRITAAVRAPTIGIGAGMACDGQILVTPDMLGAFERVPRFVRRYGTMREQTQEAVKAYAEDVRAGRFPAEAETYALKPKAG
jgi:3-methyl-2-oxobutanoate hydroxymethyltransferase